MERASTHHSLPMVYHHPLRLDLAIYNNSIGKFHQQDWKISSNNISHMAKRLDACDLELPALHSSLDTAAFRFSQGPHWFGLRGELHLQKLYQPVPHPKNPLPKDLPHPGETITHCTPSPTPSSHWCHSLWKYLLTGAGWINIWHHPGTSLSLLEWRLLWYLLNFSLDLFQWFNHLLCSSKESPSRVLNSNMSKSQRSKGCSRMFLVSNPFST